MGFLVRCEDKDVIQLISKKFENSSYTPVAPIAPVSFRKDLENNNCFYLI